MTHTWHWTRLDHLQANGQHGDAECVESGELHVSCEMYVSLVLQKWVLVGDCNISATFIQGNRYNYPLHQAASSKAEVSMATSVSSVTHPLFRSMRGDLQIETFPLALKLGRA
jgi:hypothetical protein